MSYAKFQYDSPSDSEAIPEKLMEGLHHPPARALVKVSIWNFQELIRASIHTKR